MTDNLPKQKFSALKTLADISHIITSSHDAAETLIHAAETIAERIHVDACSIYVCEGNEKALVLKATHGLNKDAIGHIKMLPSEGLVGLVLEKSATVRVAEMKKHPRFKPFPEINEEPYSSFLGVPLIEHRKAFGVLVVHTTESREFSEEEEHILVTIASQIAGLISKAILMEKLAATEQVQSSTRFTGTPVAQGVAIGQVVLMQKHALDEPEKTSLLSPKEELKLFHNALEETTIGTLELIEKVSEFVGPDEAAIFHVHLMFLEDHGFREKIEQYIKKGSSAAWAIFQVIHEYLTAFEEIADPYLRERGADLRDMGYRLLHHTGYGHLSSVDHEGILVTRQLLPADVAHLDPEKVKGIITSSGGAVSHASILARSRLIPAVCISEEDIEKIKEGDSVAVDGKHGYVILNPGEEINTEFQRLLLEQKKYLSQLDSFRTKLCKTKDGVHISTLANVGLVSDTHILQHHGAEGVGLYRTEVYFLSLDRYPTIEEQVEVYTTIIESVDDQDPVTIRTLDIGADKSAPYMGFVKEDNPFMGNRAIRMQMMNPEPLKNQIKAVLLAARGRKNVQLLFPMILQHNELKFIKNLYQASRLELEEQGYEVPELPLGMMFEIPATVVMCEQFIVEIDFFAIGSNDLTQYVLAVDRNNSHVSHLYDPLHPAVLNLIKTLIVCANKHNKPVELCGEMASDPEGCIILIGLGLRHLSMNAALIPIVKERLSFITIKEAEMLAQQALLSKSANEVRANINSFFDSLAVKPSS